MDEIETIRNLELQNKMLLGIIEGKNEEIRRLKSKTEELRDYIRKNLTKDEK